MTHETAATTPRAVLVGILLPNVKEAENTASLAELSRLVQTLGFDVVKTITQKRASKGSAAMLGEGKLKELSNLTGGTGVIPSGAKRKPNKAQVKRAEEEGEEEEDDTPAVSDDTGEPLDPLQRPNIVIVDAEMTPSQMRNLEKATGVEVLDGDDQGRRTGDRGEWTAGEGAQAIGDEGLAQQ